jgi:hypothetical protein
MWVYIGSLLIGAGTAIATTAMIPELIDCIEKRDDYE